MSVDAASAGCCCGGQQGGLDCPQWLQCAPTSLLFSWSRTDASVRRYPAGGQYSDVSTFTASGSLSLGMDGVYRGTLQCAARQTWDLETAAGGQAWEEDGQCSGNPWGCPNLDCCATRLDATDELVYPNFAIGVVIRCVPAQAGFNNAIEMYFDDGGATVEWTRRQTTLFCADPSVPNPVVTTDRVPAMSVFSGFTNLSNFLALPRECLPTNFFDQYNYDQTTVQTQQQTSDLICYRRTFLPPYFEVAGSCLSNVQGEDRPTICGDVVTTSRNIQTVTFG